MTTVNCPENGTVGTHLKDAMGMTNSIDPDQTAPPV